MNFRTPVSLNFHQAVPCARPHFPILRPTWTTKTLATLLWLSASRWKTTQRFRCWRGPRLPSVSDLEVKSLPEYVSLFFLAIFIDEIWEHRDPPSPHTSLLLSDQDPMVTVPAPEWEPLNATSGSRGVQYIVLIGFDSQQFALYISTLSNETPWMRHWRSKNAPCLI